MFSSLKHFFQGKEPANIYEGFLFNYDYPGFYYVPLQVLYLAVSGVLMQGLFRNPIVEPGLVGTSAGAALGASIVFVLAPISARQIKSITGPLLSSAGCICRRIAGNIYCLCTGKKCKTCFHYVLIINWHCYKCSLFKRHRFYELYSP